ncbi:MAG: hypothetical protein CM1200mP39_10120 [Dehalococcoidia bacterium]|nr:MAG: hypothetical protein CM1200mP39_10120 [Dehalococcoidia bacterium]
MRRSRSAHLLANGKSERGLVIGFDTRYGSPEFAKAVRYVKKYGIKTFTLDVAVHTCLSFAVVINPRQWGDDHSQPQSPEWNGFKIKSSAGGLARL